MPAILPAVARLFWDLLLQGPISPAQRPRNCGLEEGASSTVLLAGADPDDRGDHSAWKLQRGGIRHAGKRARTGCVLLKK